jgi:hypothetical protein
MMMGDRERQCGRHIAAALSLCAMGEYVQAACALEQAACLLRTMSGPGAGCEQKVTPENPSNITIAENTSDNQALPLSPFEFITP